MSRVVVPCNGPVLLVMLAVTLRLAGKPRVESFPNWSCVLTTGCVPKGAPAVALPGCVMNANCAMAAGLIAMTVEVVLVTPLLLKRIVMFVATLWNKFV